MSLSEVGVRRGLEWLSGRWFRGILIAGSLVALSIPLIRVILEPENTEGVTVLAAFVWGVAAVGGYACYRYILHDMIPLALIVSNVCVILLTLIGKSLFHHTRGDDAGLFLLFSLIILAVVSSAAFLLRKTSAKMENEIGNVGDE